jgi:hypothetical protein
VLTLALVGGCSGSTPQLSLDPPRPAPGQEDYPDIRTRWTRSARIIKQLDTTLRVHVTCFAPEFISAYVARRAHLFKLSPAEKTELARQLDEEWSNSFVFLVAAATVDFSWNDFDHKNTVWRVALVAGKNEVTPSEIRRERVSATTRELFPFVGRFYEVYSFRFPKTLADGRPLVHGGTEALVLRLAGPLGNAELEWRLR